MLRRFTIYYYARSPKNTHRHMAPTHSHGHMAHNNGLSFTTATQLTQLRKISRLDQYPVTTGWPSKSPASNFECPLKSPSQNWRPI